MLVCYPECHKLNRLPLERIKEKPICGECKLNLLKGSLDANQASFNEILQA
jgi:thioredoxin 2